MASKHEVIGPSASVPERVFPLNHIDIVSDSVLHGIPGMGINHKDIMSEADDTERQEKNMGFFRIPSPKLAHLHAVDEDPFQTQYALGEAIVKNWRLSFLVHIYLKMFLHFQVAPALSSKPWNYCCHINTLY